MFQSRALVADIGMRVTLVQVGVLRRRIGSRMRASVASVECLRVERAAATRKVRQPYGIGRTWKKVALSVGQNHTRIGARVLRRLTRHLQSSNYFPQLLVLQPGEHLDG